MLNYLREKFRSRKKNLKFKRTYEKFKKFTMIPEPVYINNLVLAQRINDLDGCVVECGVWRGGMAGGLADILGDERFYYLFDSFQGLPKAQEIDGKSALDWQTDINGTMYFDNCYAPKEYAEEAMSISCAKKYTLGEGWFEETLPNFKSDTQIALLRLDADWYESTKTCLDNLFDLVKEGGLIILDDYYAWDGCSKALHDFLSKNSRSERIESFNGICFIIKKSYA
jgi:O-methyltransferase